MKLGAHTSMTKNKNCLLGALRKWSSSNHLMRITSSVNGSILFINMVNLVAIKMLKKTSISNHMNSFVTSTFFFDLVDSFS
jgi:hypothetical protein